VHLNAANLLHMYEVRELLEDEGARRSTQRFDSLLGTDQRVCRRLRSARRARKRVDGPSDFAI
jgi:hypothetical protein